MRPLHPRSTTSDEHAEAVSRRLATLSAELAAVRGDPPLPHRHTQVRGLYAVDPGPESDSSAADLDVEDFGDVPIVPVPGRHSTRGPMARATSATGAPVVSSAARFSSRFHLSGGHVAVVVTVIAVAIAVAAWLAVRSDPEQVPTLAPVGEPLVSTSALPGAPPSETDAAASEVTGDAAGDVTGDVTGNVTGDVTVDVAGKVRRPGIAVLPPGSRVVDAVEAAGGARRGVQLSSLNLARPLVDGEQILVGVPVPAGVVGSLGAEPTTGDSGPLVNINTADQTTLETLPGVGPVTAEAIASWRTEHGGFTAVEELLEVDGIGDATLAEIAPHVTI